MGWITHRRPLLALDLVFWKATRRKRANVVANGRRRTYRIRLRRPVTTGGVSVRWGPIHKPRTESVSHWRQETKNIE